MAVSYVENFDETSAIDKLPRLCQCCFIEDDDLKSMCKIYKSKGKDEVYSDMLKDCFFILLEVQEHDDEIMICDQCITKLRTSYSFKQQIISSQNKIQTIMKQVKTCISKTELDELKDESESMTDDYIERPSPSNTDDEGHTIQDESDEDDYEMKTSIENLPMKSENESDILSSDHVLQKALERTQRNLSLLNVKLQDPIAKKKMLENLPTDKKERRNLLRRLNYEKKLPYKLNKTDRNCKECKAYFPSYKALLGHMPQHYPNYICTQCGKVFAVYEYLQRHMLRHESEMVSCNLCGRSIKQASMSRHLLAHTGQNFVHKCHYCPDKFKSYTTFMNHMVNEHNHKCNDYKCDMCSRVFKVMGELRRHVRRVHLGEKCNRTVRKTKQSILIN